MPRDSGCVLCPLGNTATHACVWGKEVGIYDGIMVLGMAPGWEEDRDGVPFVGRSGKLLDEALAEAGISNYYKTNVCKCYPGGPGDPPRDALKACRDYLEEEIAELKPKYILTLGNCATQRILGQGKITEIAGKEIHSEKYNTTVMPALHPAAILRFMGKKSGWMGDIRRFGVIVRGELQDHPPVTVHIADTEEKLDALADRIVVTLRAGGPVSYDVEASYGLDWWHREYKVYTIGFGFADGSATVVPFEHPDWMGNELWRSDVLDFFGDIYDVMVAGPGVRLAHNALYDNLAIYRIAGYLPHTTWDTMAAWHVIDENSLKGLKYLARTVLGWPDYDIDSAKALDIPFKDLAFYNGCDTVATVMLYHKEIELLEKEPDLLEYFRTVPSPGIDALCEVEKNGVHIDTDLLRERAKIALERAEAARERLPVENPGSTKQVAGWLYGEEEMETVPHPDPIFAANGDTVLRPTGRRIGGLGLPIIKATKKGNPSTDEDTITRLALDHPEVRTILDYRKPMKQVGTYFAPTLGMARDSFDGRAHFEYRIASVETGRVSSRFHVMPRDSFVRNIVAAEPGWTLLSPDYAQIEARLAAWAAIHKPASWDRVPERSMMYAFGQGRDVYIETAAEALGKRPEAVTRDKDDPMNERQIMGKVPTLACLYKISPTGLRRYAWEEFEVDWSIQQATRLWNAFNRRWAEFPMWHEREEKAIKARGWVRSVLGRRRRIPEASGFDKTAAEDAVRSGINMPIQGLASDIAWYSLTTLYSALAGKPYIRLVGWVHDSLLIEVRNDMVEKVSAFVSYIMEISYKQLEPLGLRLPDGLVKVDMSSGLYWGKKWKQK